MYLFLLFSANLDTFVKLKKHCSILLTLVPKHGKYSRHFASQCINRYEEFQNTYSNACTGLKLYNPRVSRVIPMSIPISVGMMIFMGSPVYIVQFNRAVLESWYNVGLHMCGSVYVSKRSKATEVE